MTIGAFRIPPPPFKDSFEIYQLWNSYVNELQRFYPFPDLYDDTNTDYYYFGWESVNGDWLIRKRSKTSSMYTECNSTHNPPHGTLNDAWVNRTSLTYP